MRDSILKNENFKCLYFYKIIPYSLSSIIYDYSLANEVDKIISRHDFFWAHTEYIINTEKR